MAELQFIRTCPSCGHKIDGGKFKVFKHSLCEKCGAKMSPPKRFYGKSKEDDKPKDSEAMKSPSIDYNASVLESQQLANNSIASDYNRPDDSFVVQTYEYDPFSVRPASCPDSDHQKLSQTEVSAHTSSAIAYEQTDTTTYALKLRDGSLTIDLPRVEGEGIVGRSFAGASALSLFATVSRRQFSYRYLPEGGLRITNLSRYGTSVNGQMLTRDELTGVAQGATIIPPSILTMGGHDFDLVVSHG